jgi:uncharacterized protein (DUF4213/DUF364 family)
MSLPPTFTAARNAVTRGASTSANKTEFASLLAFQKKTKFGAFVTPSGKFLSRFFP